MCVCCFFFNDTATTEIYTLSLHDALPISEQNLSDRQVEFATTIHNAGADLLALISDILDLSKVEAGKMDVHPRHVPLAEVAGHVQRSFSPVAEKQGLELAINLADDLPEAIETDEQRLQQVLKNLLSNAFKFTESGSVTLDVRRAQSDVAFAGEVLNRASSVIAFSVTDTGIGIAEDKLRLIFEAFQQADGTTSRRYGGTGLGLSISREIARLLGGEIRVSSTEGEGSTFTLYLPESWTVVEHAPPAPEEELEAAPVLAALGAGPNGDVVPEPDPAHDVI